MQVQGRAKISVQAVTKYQRSSSSSSSSNSRAVRHARHERKQSICENGSVSLTGDAIGAVVLGCAGTGQGLEARSVRSTRRDERSLNWRAEPASHARLECIERRATKAPRDEALWWCVEALGCFSRKNANRTGARSRSGGPLWEVGERRLNVRASERCWRRASTSPRFVACGQRLLDGLWMPVRLFASACLRCSRVCWGCCSCTTYNHGRHMACTYTHAYTHTTHSQVTQHNMCTLCDTAHLPR